MAIPSIHAQLLDASNWLMYVGEWVISKHVTAKVPRFKPCWMFFCDILLKENNYMIKRYNIDNLRGCICQETAAILLIFYNMYSPVWNIIPSHTWMPGATTCSILNEGMQSHKDQSMYLPHQITISAI
jgi:hypothetical protein